MGAAGDGKADDTVAIQKALETIQSGSTLYLPPGNYRITKTVRLTGPLIGVSVIGHGRDTTLVWDGEAGGKLFAQAVEPNMYAAIDGLVDKLDVQIRKHKEKVTDHHRSRGGIKDLNVE